VRSGRTQETLAISRAVADNISVLEVCENPEQIFSLAALSVAIRRTRISENAPKGEKSHQGVAGQKSVLHRGIEWSNSTLALGLEEWRGKTALGTAVGNNSGVCDVTTGANCGPSQCDAQCQQQQAEQSAQNALNDPGCAQAVDGGTGAASSTIAGTPGASMGTIQPGGTNPGVLATTDPNQLPDFTSLYPSQANVTLSTNNTLSNAGFFIGSLPGGGYFCGDVAGYACMASQTIVLLHETGHQAYVNGLPTIVAADGPAYTGGDQDLASQLSQDNNANVGAACMPQGDFGGNQGPVDTPPSEVPAVSRPVKHHF
jgi:hypothetical protein